MKSLIDYLNCGIIVIPKNEEAVYFKVIKFSDNYDKIIPFSLNTLLKGKNLRI
jgi:hypothetical protein